MKLYIKSFIFFVLGSLAISCGATDLLLTPVANIDVIPKKISELTANEKKSWGHADLITDTIPGMSLNKAYNDIIGKKKGETVIVAVVDSGIDLAHEDLDGVLWKNTDEHPKNGIDDDNNGYVDDIHGYNFLGDSYNEQLEYSRILRLGIGDAAIQEKAQKKWKEEFPKALSNKQRYEQILQSVNLADEAIKKELGKDNYTEEDLKQISTEDLELQQHVAILKQMYQYADSIEEVMEELESGVTYFSERADYNLNKDFDGRKVVGDDPYDFNSRDYGNGDPQNQVKDESHGTHVAGIIAAERNNGIGMNGVANNVKIMAIRAVPNGDEYDKDIALAIRYATDNGAKIINCSFGKSFSPNAEWVYDAIRYAASKDVLIVHAAGNDGKSVDDPNNPNYPNDHQFSGSEIANNVITVGALSATYGSELVAPFSNYGNNNVDVFAPGDDIYATMPNNEYDYNSGTSMAAPAVSGVAALIRSHYPNLNASQVKNILMESGLTSKATVILNGDTENTKPFSEVSKSGKMVNAYNALILASKISKGKQTPTNSKK